MTSSCKAWDLLVSSRSRGGKLYFCPTQDPLPFFAQPDWASWCSSTCTYTAIRLRGRTGHTDCSSDSSGFFLQRKVRNRDMKAHILLSPTSRVRTGTPQAICDKTEAPKPAMRILRLHFSVTDTPRCHTQWPSLAWIPSGRETMHALSTCPSFTSKNLFASTARKRNLQACRQLSDCRSWTVLNIAR